LYGLCEFCANNKSGECEYTLVIPMQHASLHTEEDCTIRVSGGFGSIGEQRCYNITLTITTGCISTKFSFVIESTLCSCWATIIAAIKAGRNYKCDAGCTQIIVGSAVRITGQDGGSIELPRMYLLVPFEDIHTFMNRVRL
jgi:hypothetical protein